MDLKINEMSNAELKLQMKSYENEYENLKIQIGKKLDRLNHLDIMYLEIVKELTKRNVL